MLAQRGDKCSQHGDRKTRVYEAGGHDDLARWIFPNGRNYGGFTGDGGLIESEEDGAEEGSGLLVGIGLEFGMDIDDESGADGRKQTCLSTRTHEMINKSK